MAPLAKAAWSAGTRPPKARMVASGLPALSTTRSTTERAAGSSWLAAKITPTVSRMLFFAASMASTGRSSNWTAAAKPPKWWTRSSSARPGDVTWSPAASANPP